MNNLVLKVNGEKHGGWKQVHIHRSIEQIASGFSLSYTERRLAEDEPRDVAEGDECVVSIDNADVIMGYVDDSNIDYDAKTHGMTVNGRSKTADLVDCSAIHKTGQWLKRTVEQIAKDICQPFGIGVQAEADISTQLTKFTIQDGESAFETLDRLARMHGLLILSDAGKNIIFTRAGSVKVKPALEFGVNILRGRREGTWRDRFQKYILKGQAPATDNFFGKKASSPTATTEDNGINRYRPIVIQADDVVYRADLTRRAVWECNTRAGKSQRLSYTLVGSWSNEQGIWQPNTIVDVKDSYLGLETEMLIAGVDLIADDRGIRTELDLAGPAAYDIKDLPRAKPKKTKWGLY